MGFVGEDRAHLIWEIKYLVLVMVRFNYLSPEEVSELLSFMKEYYQEKENCEYFLYILWRTATNMWGYQKEERFL